MIVEILLSAGVLLMAIGTLGILRLPDFMSRFHSSTIIATLGSACILFAIVYYGFAIQNFAYIRQPILILAAIMLTGAVGSHAMARAQFLRGEVPDNLGKNEFPKPDKADADA
ncbi:MAG: monovalent cation/H(+) antiporter subunit G [Candidatus Micrarchaeota archaeon]|nr:monovalent cation/H(+) antiporter subunit G [Candidatus Micrarchaeota archaeon]